MKLSENDLNDIIKIYNELIVIVNHRVEGTEVTYENVRIGDQLFNSDKHGFITVVIVESINDEGINLYADISIDTPSIECEYKFSDLSRKPKN